MTFARYLLGLLLAAVAFVPVGVGVRALRARLLPDWAGPPAWLADIVTGLALVVGVTEVLGAVGLFRLAPTVVALAGAGMTALVLGRRRNPVSHTAVDEPLPALAAIRTVPTNVVLDTSTGGGVRPQRAWSDRTDTSVARAESGPAAPPLGRVARWVGIGATAFVVAEWSNNAVLALRGGMNSYDTLWYHLPVATRFVQEGSITGLHYLEGQAVTVFFPANSALLHALGIMFLGNDLLSPLLNMGWLALALMAAWCVGRPFGLGPVTLTGAALVFGTPTLVGSQPGQGYDDIVGVALFLAAAALLASSDRTCGSPHLAEIGVAALAAGLALGTKFTFVAPVAVLSIGVCFLAPRGERLRRGGLWLLLVGLTGGFWYARNLWAVQNPIPFLDLQLGPFSLPSPAIRSKLTSLSEYLFDRRARDVLLVPGLRTTLGRAWWVLLAFTVIGLLLGVVASRRPVHRVLAFVGFATLAAFVFGPQSLEYGGGGPFFFTANVRYIALALVFGVVLLPLVPSLATRRRAWLPLVGYALVLAAGQLESGWWTVSHRVDWLVGIAILIAGGALLAWRRRRPGRRAAAVAVAVACAIGLAGGFVLQQLYLDRRYSQVSRMSSIYGWAENKHDERIAVVGDVRQYPLYGNDLSNHVQYMGARGPHGAYAPITKCADWRRALNAGHYSYVLVTAETIPIPALGKTPPEAAWTDADSAATLILRRGDASLYRLHGRMNPDGCSKPS